MSRFDILKSRYKQPIMIVGIPEIHAQYGAEFREECLNCGAEITDENHDARGWKLCGDCDYVDPEEIGTEREEPQS